MGKWKLEKQNKYKDNVIYKADIDDGHKTLDFDTYYKTVEITDEFDDGYKRYKDTSVILDIEDTEFILAKMKELFKE